jgi:hypothetical protein
VIPFVKDLGSYRQVASRLSTFPPLNTETPKIYCAHELILVTILSKKAGAATYEN